METSPDPILTLYCWVFGTSQAVLINISKTKTVDELKKTIRDRKIKKLEDVDDASLTIWKVSIPSQGFPENFDQSRFPEDVGARQLAPDDELSEVFVELPLKKHVHIIAKTDSLSYDRPSKRPRLDAEPHTSAHAEPSTPVNKGAAARTEVKDTPPRLSRSQLEPNMAEALVKYLPFMKHLADGSLDPYFNSISPEDKNQVLKAFALPFKLPINPNLLLHNLGKGTDSMMFADLFTEHAVHLFNVSGSGKTRMLLNGACHNWTFYFTCRRSMKLLTGSGDVESAFEVMEGMSKWHADPNSGGQFLINSEVAARAFAMLLCSRTYVFGQFLRLIPEGMDIKDARRRWVYLQVTAPIAEPGSDMFTEVFEAIQGGSGADLQRLSADILKLLFQDKPLLFPSHDLFCAIDEAQAAVQSLRTRFRSTGPEPIEPRGVLHEIYKAFDKVSMFKGFIFSGTGLSMDVVRSETNSISAKEAGRRSQVFTKTGNFLDPAAHESYIQQYLYLKNDTASDRRLLDRIKYWLRGRYRFTATFIELLLLVKDAPRHRTLSFFVKQMTGFIVTDAHDLEQAEGSIPVDVIQRANVYAPPISDGDFFAAGRELLTANLADAVMRWSLGSEPTVIPVENGVFQLVELGVCLLEASTPQEFGFGAHPSAYLREPLVALNLNRIFSKRIWTEPAEWVSRMLRASANRAAVGAWFEKVTLLILMDKFGDRYTALGDVFNFAKLSTLASREVTLVSLIKTEGVEYRNVSWTKGASDCLGLQARSVEDVLRFFDNPDGKAFLFPDNHMGPDLICFLQDKETEELIVVTLQAKATPNLNHGVWLKAIQSVTPDFFYTEHRGGEMVQYAPVSYPSLWGDVDRLFIGILGKEAYQGVVNEYRKKLRSESNQAPAQSMRRTPRYLRIVACPDDQQAKHLGAESADDAATLKWAAVVECIGSSAHAVRDLIRPLHGNCASE